MKKQDLEDLCIEIQRKGVCLPGYGFTAKRHWLWDSAVSQEPDYVSSILLGTVDETDEDGVGPRMDVYAGITVYRDGEKRPWIDALWVEEYYLHSNLSEEWTLWLAVNGTVPEILTSERIMDIQNVIDGTE